jgi:hypothetical protein
MFYLSNPEDVEVVGAMYEITWPSALASFGTMVEESDDGRITALCLEAYRHLIRIGCAFSVDAARDTFVSSLAHLTLLGASKEMKLKNVEAFTTLLSVAHFEANFLKTAWASVLTVISEFDKLQESSSSRSNSDLFQMSPSRSSSRLTSAPNTNSSNPNVALALQQKHLVQMQNLQLLSKVGLLEAVARSIVIRCFRLFVFFLFVFSRLILA